MESEAYFLQYAMPCAFIVRDMGEITEKDLQELEHAAIQKVALPREKLEKIFFRAFEKIDRHAKKIGGSRWDKKIIETYFKNAHNNEIDRKEGYYADCGEMQRELSKVRIGTIKEIKGEFYVVQFESGKNRNVFSKLLPNKKIGDRVYTHFFFAVESAD